MRSPHGDTDDLPGYREDQLAERDEEQQAEAPWQTRPEGYVYGDAWPPPVPFAPAPDRHSHCPCGTALIGETESVTGQCRACDAAEAHGGGRADYDDVLEALGGDCWPEPTDEDEDRWLEDVTGFGEGP